MHSVLRYQAINTLNYIISSASSRKYIQGFREELVIEMVKMVPTCAYEKFFDVILKMFK